MKIIKIKRSITLEGLEPYYKELSDAMRNNVGIDLSIPKKLDNDFLGLVPALLQFAITWLRYENSKKLLLEIEAPSNSLVKDLSDLNPSYRDDLETLYENELIFPLVALVWNKNGVFDKTGETSLRGVLKLMNTDVYQKMQRGEPLKDKKLLLTNFDHLPEKVGILPCFENSDGFVDNESEMEENLYPGLSYVLNFSLDVRKAYLKERKALIGIIYELMKNTFEWAKKDQNMVPLDPNIRGLLIKFYKRRRNSMLEEINHSALPKYISSSVLKENVNGEIYFLEISVFDSGVGFINKHKSLNPADSNLDEMEIVKKCLIKHMTSAQGLNKDDKGLGLDRILTILSGKGFLQIRTGNVYAYRNLITHPYKTVNHVEDMELFEWNTPNDRISVEGSVITIVYPLSVNDN